MSKPRTEPVGAGEPGAERRRDARGGSEHGPNEPLSGSKKVKNRNHSRHNNGEG